MSEKRFTYDKPLVAFSKGGINDNVTGETYEFTMDTVLDLLNELSEENEQLRQQLQEYKENWDDMVKLATKTSLRNVELDEQIGRLQRENVQLRKELPLCHSKMFILEKGLDNE